MGNISQVERTQRLFEVQNLLDQGISEPSKISNKLGMSLDAVRRNIRYLDDLIIAELDPAQIAEKRKELYLELIEAAGEAREQFDKYKKLKDGGVNSKRFFDSWMETIKMRQSLFGLDSVKVDSLTQISNITQYNQPYDKLDNKISESITKAIKENHESKLRYKDLEE
jgi:hypothetical protein